MLIVSLPLKAQFISLSIEPEIIAMLAVESTQVYHINLSSLPNRTRLFNNWSNGLIMVFVLVFDNNNSTLRLDKRQCFDMRNSN